MSRRTWTTEPPCPKTAVLAAAGAASELLCPLLLSPADGVGGGGGDNRACLSACDPIVDRSPFLLSLIDNRVWLSQEIPNDTEALDSLFKVMADFGRRVQ